MTKQEKVAAWMSSLGFVKGNHYFTHKDMEMDISEDEATFFYDAVEEARNQAKLDEHKVIQVAVTESFNEAAAEGDSYNALKIFDDWRASRYRDLLRHLKQEGKTNG